MAILFLTTSVLAGQGASAQVQAAPWNGVPHLTVDYNQDVETWWSQHPFNPQSSNYRPDIQSPSNQVNAQTQFGGNIQAAIDSLPASGGTVYLPAGTYTSAFNIIGKSNVHIISDGGAVIRTGGTSQVAGCQLATDYTSFNLAVASKDPSAVACATTNRISNIYFKNLTFDGTGSSLIAVTLNAAMDVVFDNVTFQNYRDPGDEYHRGLISGSAVLDNIWVRNSHFVGSEAFALYLDGLHGGGVINSTIDGNFRRGALLFLTNDDFTKDYNSNGTLDPWEIRSAQHNVVYGNTFAGGTYDVVSVTGRDNLVKNNTIQNRVTTLGSFDSKTALVNDTFVYRYFGNRIVGNRAASVNSFMEITAATCPAGQTNIAQSGQYQIRDNNSQDPSGQPVNEINTSCATIQGPNVVSNNCFGSNCASGTTPTPAATQTPAPPTPTATPGTPVLPAPSGGGAGFPLGIFEDGNMTYGVVSDFQAMINNAKAHGLDSVLFTNNSATRDEPMLSVSDSLNFNVFFAPHYELDRNWWPSSVAATLDNARSAIYPLVDLVKGHASVKGYNVADEPTNDLQDKVVLAVQAFKERAPGNAISPVLIGINRGDVIDAAANPSPMLIDVYPIGYANPACDYTMTGFGYTNLDFSGYVRAMTKNKPADTPLWIILQTHNFGTDPLYSLRQPSVPEVRAQNWMAIGEGATGIFWFIYSSEQGWTGLKDNPTLFQEVASLANRVAPLRGTLLGLRRTSDQFSVSGGPNPYISTLTSKDGTKTYAVVVNKGSCASDQSLSVSSTSGLQGQLRDLETNQVYALDSPIAFPPGDGKIFEFVGTGAVTTTPSPISSPSPTVTGTSTGVNLIQDPSFEVDAGGYPANWISRPTASRDTTVAHSGGASLQMTGPADYYSYQSLDLSPNKQYTLSFWVKTQGISGPGVAMRYPQLNAPADVLGQSAYTNGTNDWTQVVTTFNTPSSYSSGRVDIQWQLNAGDAAWIDDVSLCEGPVPCDAGSTPPPPTPVPAVVPSPTSTPVPTAVPSPTPTPVPTFAPSLTPTVNRTNRVQNPSFEANAGGYPASWVSRPTGSWDSTVAHSGKASLKVTGSADYYSYQSLDLSPNKQYTFSFWVKTQGVSGKGVAMRYPQLNAPTDVLGQSAFINGTRDWTRITTTFTTPSSYSSGRLDVQWELNSGDVAWIDDVSLCEGSTPCN
ncbi:MAG: carbohydrate binding domain-containing protein [Bacteroidetes bacterium]|nr:carbohydrate binding domain-containing protein [Bacteroidota bacterium]MCL5025032.1 carbohydrate binding domain-containing protein [Chloroflexota bacterium]